MSLQPQEVSPVPDETRRIARAAFPKGNLYIRMRDALGAISHGQLCAPVFSTRGQPAAAPWRLALTTIMPCAEGLSERQAVDAVRSRIDWKYACSLELTDPGVDVSIHRPPMRSDRYPQMPLAINPSSLVMATGKATRVGVKWRSCCRWVARRVLIEY
jgi:hypothetical protein